MLRRHLWKWEYLGGTPPQYLAKAWYSHLTQAFTPGSIPRNTWSQPSLMFVRTILRRLSTLLILDQSNYISYIWIFGHKIFRARKTETACFPVVATHLQALKFELQEEVCCSQVVAQTTSAETQRLRLTRRCCCSEDSLRVVRCSRASPSAARARGGPAALAALACSSC